jgi:hypothetical protein
VIGVVENDGMMSLVPQELRNEYKKAFDDDWKNCKT